MTGTFIKLPILVDVLFSRASMSADERSDKLFDTDVLEGLDINMIVEGAEEVDLDDPEYQPNENSSTRTHTNFNVIPNITLLPAVRPSTTEPANEAGLAPANKGGNGEVQAEGNPCQGSPLVSFTTYGIS